MHNLPPQPSGWPVIGQDQPVGILRRSLRTGRLSHAYLFTGPNGIGKRTVALALAMTVNCLGEVPPGQPWPDVPCLLCPSCARIMRGAHPDVSEVNLEVQAQQQGESGKKGAPSRELRIDVVRDMQATLGLNPHSARRKVYLIGDADRLNEEASNCLLKTLEEPPEHSMLVLMAPDDEAVLPTISSRCVQLQFRPLSKALVASSLASVWGAEEEQAETLAALSGGRLGYAVGLIGNDQALARRRAALEEAALLTGAPVLDRVEAAARYAKRYTDARSELFDMLDEWETWWRDVMVVKVGAGDLAVSVDQLPSLNSIARRTPVAKAADAVRLIQQTRKQLLENVNPRLALEALTLGLP
ncbi:MAG TPA: DNA polymerase III subunit delta' [Chloroflexia bacterium]